MSAGQIFLKWSVVCLCMLTSKLLCHWSVGPLWSVGDHIHHIFKRKTQQSNVQMSNNESDSSIPFSNCGRRIRMDGDKIEKNCYFSQTQFPSTFLLFLYQASKTMWHFEHISHIVCNISHIVCNITSAAYQHSPNLLFSRRFGSISGFWALRYIFKR